jgi:glycine betaine/proline transport system permease protein
MSDSVDFIQDNKIPIGKWTKHYVDYIADNYADFFDSVSDSLKTFIDALLWLLQLPSPIVATAIVAVITWLIQRSIAVTIFVSLGLLLIVNQGYWEETTQTLALVISATTFCMLIGIPMGILLARKPWLYRIMRPILDLMQTIPTFVYLIPTMVLFGLGVVPGLISTVVFSLPASIRLTYLGIKSTPSALIEAGQAFGSTGAQILWKIEIPFAMPQIRAGLTQTIMLSLSMVVIAALVGADGLGVPTVRALNTQNIAKGFEVGLCIVLVAIILDRILNKEEAEQ